MTTFIAPRPASPLSPVRFFARIDELLLRLLRDLARRPRHPGHRVSPLSVECPHMVAWRSSLGR